MTKVVIPVSRNFLSEKFNDCTYYQIVEIDNETTVSRKEGIPSELFLHKLPLLVQHYGISDVIAYRIDKASLNFISDTKVNLFVGVNISSPDRLIDAYLDDTLKSNTFKLWLIGVWNERLINQYKRKTQKETIIHEEKAKYRITFIQKQKSCSSCIGHIDIFLDDLFPIFNMVDCWCGFGNRHHLGESFLPVDVPIGNYDGIYDETKSWWFIKKHVSIP